MPQRNAAGAGETNDASPAVTDQRAQQLAFFRRSYTAVDGLWFMKVEEALGFEGALEIDGRVWEVMPKIQARLLKELTGEAHGLAALAGCLDRKLSWEGHAFQAELAADGRALEITVSECPWYRLMVRSGRGHLAEQVGRHICSREYAIWAQEFGEGLRFELPETLCGGESVCRWRFL